MLILPPNSKDLSGLVFGKLTVLEYIGTSRQGSRWLCQCECGNTCETTTGKLNAGRTRSCGCENIKTRFESTHKATNTPTYSSWSSMKGRCFCERNKSYKNYGDRGITVCDEWKNSFETFLKDMGERPKDTTLDRKNTNGNYEPNNCIWASIYEQNNNKRNNTYITYDGKTQTLAQWSREVNLHGSVISARIKNGWSVEEALTTPSRSKTKCERLITFNGETKNVTEWAKTLGIARNKLYYRLNNGWSVEEALT